MGNGILIAGRISTTGVGEVIGLRGRAEPDNFAYISGYARDTALRTQRTWQCNCDENPDGRVNMKWSLLAWTRSDNPMPLRLSSAPEQKPSVPEQKPSAPEQKLSVPEQKLSAPERSAAPLTDAATVAAPRDTATPEAAPNATIASEATDIGASTFRAPLSEATGEDYEAWAYHLAHRNPLARRPGTTIKDEYEQFMAARVRSRLLTATKTIQPEAHSTISPEPPQTTPVTELVTAKDIMPPAQALAPTLLLTSPQAMQATAAAAGPA
jgi:hypothetical protein